MSLELVLLVPVLVLMTVFVLWAGRGGRAALTADLAAEEAATVAALCCEEGPGGAAERETLVEDMLEAPPWAGLPVHRRAAPRRAGRQWNRPRRVLERALAGV